MREKKEAASITPAAKPRNPLWSFGDMLRIASTGSAPTAVARPAAALAPVAVAIRDQSIKPRSWSRRPALEAPH
jgi:hypothetical protein